MRVQVQVEGSGKWPANEEAFAKMKAAVLCELAAALESQFGLVSRATEDYVDVHLDGYALRMWLWSDRDEASATRAAKVRCPVLRPAQRAARPVSTNIAITRAPPRGGHVRSC